MTIVDMINQVAELRNQTTDLLEKISEAKGSLNLEGIKKELFDSGENELKVGENALACAVVDFKDVWKF